MKNARDEEKDIRGNSKNSEKKKKWGASSRK